MFLFSSPQCMDLLCSRTCLAISWIVHHSILLVYCWSKWYSQQHHDGKKLPFRTSCFILAKIFNALVVGGCDEVEPSVPLWLPIILPTIRMIFCLVYGPYFYVDFLLQWSLYLSADIVSLLFFLAYLLNFLSVCLSVFRSFAVMNLLVVIFIFG